MLGVTQGERYAVLRFVAWSANHDVGRWGVRDGEKIELVNALSEKMKVFVSAEGSIPVELEPHRVKIPVSKIHDALYYASLYFGDSQTMATEAALLGTPAIRCNSFVGEGDFSNFKVLERDFDLLHNYSRFEEALARALEIAGDPDSKRVWGERREKYFATVGDVNEEILAALRGIIEN
jgi:predicted glycosyltransferase